MHMADALISVGVAGTMYAASAAAAGVSIHKVRLEDDLKKVPVMGVMGALVFATQMINFTIPGTGSSGHLCGGMLLSAMLGPYAGFLSMIGVLLIQCLLFADGGILALGCNVWNMAFYGCFVGALLIWKPFMKSGFNKKKITIASIVGCIVGLQLGAFSVCIETLISGITELPFSTFLAAMQPIHLAIGLVEGLITAAVLCFVYEARPELLYGYNEAAASDKKQKMSYKGTLVTLLVVTLFIGGALSLVASSYPDGLEWSIERLTGDTELETAETPVTVTDAARESADGIQTATALLPDYAFKDSESASGTIFSGIVGSLVVLIVCAGCAKIFKFFGNKKVTQ